MARGNPIAPGSLIGLIGSILETGVTATAGLREIREQGWGITTQTWYRVWGETAAAYANKGGLAGLDPTGVVPDLMHTDWAAGTSGRYAYQVSIILDDPESGGMGRAPYTILSDVPLSPEDAIGQATDDFAAAITIGGSGEGQKVHGGVLTGAYRMTGYQK